MMTKNIMATDSVDFELNGKIFTAHFTTKMHDEDSDPADSFDETEFADEIEMIRSGRMGWAIAEMVCVISIKGHRILEVSDFLGGISFNKVSEFLDCVKENGMEESALDQAKSELKTLLDVLA